jgi:hypothetical protein
VAIDFVPLWAIPHHETGLMGIVDIAVLVLLTSFAFIVGYAMRGLFVDTPVSEWPETGRHKPYEPPRRDERI